MNEHFLHFCTAHNLSPTVLAGKEPAWEEQSDGYSISGAGPVTGLEVERYGEFGNNVIQLLHAVYAARRLGLKRVRARSVASIFQPGTYTLHDGLQLIVGPAPSTESGSSLVGRFFFWWGTAGLLRGMSAAEAVEIARRDLRAVVNLPSSSLARNVPTLHIHIRGGSDIFGAGAKLLGAPGKLNAGYVQPPLAYYLTILVSWYSKNPDGKVVIVSMDRSNPCIGGIEQWLQENGRPYSWQSGTVEEDVGVLYSGETLVAGWGTFIPMIALLSESVRSVYFFRDPQQGPRLQAAGVKVMKVEDACQRYLARGAWTNTPEELATMLSYPVECLEIKVVPQAAS